MDRIAINQMIKRNVRLKYLNISPESLGDNLNTKLDNWHFDRVRIFFCFINLKLAFIKSSILLFFLKIIRNKTLMIEHITSKGSDRVNRPIKEI